MGKRKNSNNRSSAKTSVPPRRSGLLVWSAIALAIVVGVGTWYFIPRRSPLSDAAPYKGGPRLVVDKGLIDFGPVRFEKWVEAKFRLRNVGDQPLNLAVNSPVEAIEGC